MGAFVSGRTSSCGRPLASTEAFALWPPTIWYRFAVLAAFVSGGIRVDKYMVRYLSKQMHSRVEEPPVAGPRTHVEPIQGFPSTVRSRRYLETTTAYLCARLCVCLCVCVGG